MLILQVRQSEVALADGRLDEAFAVATAHDVGRHRRGQRLLTRLAAALVRRGQEHAAAQRYAAALQDCEKAAKLGGNVPEVVALRAAAADALAQVNRQQQRQALALAAARRHVDEGELSLGEQLLAATPDASRAGLLRDDIQQRRRRADDAATVCSHALQHGDVERAAQELIRARSANPHQEDVVALVPRVSAAVTDRLRDAVHEGRLDEARELLAHLRSLDPASPHLRRQQTVLDGLGEAWRHIQSGAFGEAGVLVARLLPLAPDAPWLKRVAEQLRQADQAIGELKVGPLAWLDGAPTPGPVVAARPFAHAPVQRHPMPQPTTPLPTQFLLHVDGVGSFLVLRQPIVTIGPISSSVAADVAVVAEPTLPPVTIVRLDDDYFLKTASHAAAPGRLLASGECLDLSPRCRLVFRLPSAASTSGVLDLAGARLPRGDVRRVILMDQDLVIGPTSASHVVAPQLDRPVVLHLSQGQIVCRATGPVTAGGRALAASEPLPIGETVHVGGASFVLAPADSKGSR